MFLQRCSSINTFEFSLLKTSFRHAQRKDPGYIFSLNSAFSAKMGIVDITGIINQDIFFVVLLKLMELLSSVPMFKSWTSVRRKQIKVTNQNEGIA